MSDPLKQMYDELGVCTEEALFYLEAFRWDLNAAMEACRSKTLPSPSLTAQPPPSENEIAAAEEEPGEDEKIKRFVESTGATVEEARYHLKLGQTYDQPEKKSKPPVPLPHDDDTEGSGLVQEVLSKVPQFHSTSTNLGSESPPWTSTAPFRMVQRSMNLFHDVVSTASIQDVTDCLNVCKGDVDDALLHYYDVCSQKEELMASFSSLTEATRQDAKSYLEQYKWDLSQALDSFFQHSNSEQQTSASPSQPQFESSYVSSGSTETQESLEEAGEGDDVTVTTSSQGDGKDAEEEETAPDPFANRDRTTVETEAAPGTIMITIYLADRTSLELPLRPNQTIGDIRDAIDQRYPDNDRGYSLQSIDGVYTDLDITVARVAKGGYTILIQTYP